MEEQDTCARWTLAGCPDGSPTVLLEGGWAQRERRQAGRHLLLREGPGPLRQRLGKAAGRVPRCFLWDLQMSLSGLLAGAGRKCSSDLGQSGWERQQGRGPLVSTASPGQLEP